MLQLGKRGWTLLLLLGSLTASLLFTVSGTRQNGLVVYTSVDQRFSEPVFRAFEAETGTPIHAVYDVEASKTTGLVSRIIAERANPQAEVFWNGEVLQMRRLAQQGILAPYRPESIAEGARLGDASAWVEFGGRARVLIVNMDRLGDRPLPVSLLDLESAAWLGDEIALAYPLFGTSATHAAALDGIWGRNRTLAFYSSLDRRDVRFVAGNSVVRDLVVSGRVVFGLTDTDDACGAVARGAPVKVVLPDQGDNALGALVIPNSVALIASNKSAESAKQFVDFLIGDKAQTQLAQLGWVYLKGRNVVGDPLCGLPNTLKPMPLSFSENPEEPALLLQSLKELIVQ